MNKTVLSVDLNIIRNKARASIAPIRTADENTRSDKDFLFKAQRTIAGRKLPPYYLVYFLLVELLEFKDLGSWEKTAWSIPIDFNGEAFLIEHRKFGLGIFARDASSQEEMAEDIVKLIERGTKIASPFFKQLAEDAVEKSKLNVSNESRDLFARFNFFLNEYKKAKAEAVSRASECIITKMKTDVVSAVKYSWPAHELNRNSAWLALAVVDSFFSWTEHIFIHIAILSLKVTTGKEVVGLAAADWPEKYKAALSLTDKANKIFFDKLRLIRKQLRNFIAHGAFGKDGEAFNFHSKAGAVPLTLEEKGRSYSLSLSHKLAFENEEAIQVIEEFITHLWNVEREPARLYIQESGLPLILTMTKDGRYMKAMKSVKDMKECLDYLNWTFDRAENMDW